MLEGRIVRALRDKRFGFIRMGKNEYFFHATDLIDYEWDELCNRFEQRENLDVDFVEVKSDKGLRAGEVKVV